jgi:hypothetical protein
MQRLTNLRGSIAKEMHPFDALLFAQAESAKEWQTLREMPMGDAAAWVAGRRVTPS